MVACQCCKLEERVLIFLYLELGLPTMMDDDEDDGHEVDYGLTPNDTKD